MLIRNISPKIYQFKQEIFFLITPSTFFSEFWAHKIALNQMDSLLKNCHFSSEFF
jgi:hypothetical protein